MDSGKLAKDIKKKYMAITRHIPLTENKITVRHGSNKTFLAPWRDPKANDTTIGPLVSDIQFNKVQTLIDAGVSEGATLLVGGTGKPDGLDKGYYVKPTVFGDVTNDMTIAREEIFGPVLSIITYTDIDEAISIANDSEYGLAAYVAGKNKEDLTAIARRLRAGQIHLNYGSGGADAPFGGYKQSGNGREKAEWGFEEFLEVKAIMGG